MRITLDEMIREEAKRNIGRYNLIKKVSEREFKINHHNICKKLVEYSDSHDKFPMTLLVYIAVGRNAHRKYVFEKGYTNFDVKTADRVLYLADIFAKKFGEKTRTNDRLIHAIFRYVHKCDGGVLKFKQMVNSLYDIDPDFSMKSISTAKALSQLLYADDAVFSPKGYIIEVSNPTRHSK